MKYRDAGVDIELAGAFVERIRGAVQGTRRPEVVSDIGSFGGIFQINPLRFRNPLLVASTDGVGTKIMIAKEMKSFSTIGIDLVAMGANDVVAHGAEPLFFLDYFATGKLRMEEAVSIVEGIAEGCKAIGCALIGGETAEMPYLYREGEFDLAGFCVGVVERERLIDGSSIAVGNRIIGLASSGFHSNGYSLLIKTLLEEGGLKLDNPCPYNPRITLGEDLLTPARLYVRMVLNLMKDFDIKGIAHITGGGILDNLPRILPPQCQARIVKGSWEIPERFHYIRKMGDITEEEMFRVFNMGIGMVLVTDGGDVEDILLRTANQNMDAFLMGEITKRGDGPPVVLL